MSSWLLRKTPVRRERPANTPLLTLSLVILVSLVTPSFAELPKPAREAVKNKYSGKKCVIQATAIPARSAGTRRVFMEAGQMHAPIAESEALDVKAARVEVRNGMLAGKQDEKAVEKFTKGEVVEVGKVNFKKDYIEFQISDRGKPSPGYRSTQLRLYLDEAVMTGGNLEEISQAIDQWFKPVGTP